MKFIFGGSDYDNKMVINAESLEEAKQEFALSCDDVSRYAYKGDSCLYGIRDEPYGFTDGKPNEDYSRPNFYKRIKIRQENTSDGRRTYGEVGEITVYDIELIIATPQHLLLTNKTGNTEANDVVQSRGMIMLRQQSREIQLQFRHKQLELLHMKATSSNQMAIYKDINRQNEKEQKKIQEKINVLQTYSGIGKDLTKVCSGENSKADKVMVFQSFGYMRESIELLTDFEDFDFRSLEKFDEFLAKNYQKIMPNSLSIQAFAISKFPILYKTETMFGDVVEKDEENDKIFIVIRNGENIYRMFNKYKLNGKLFHSEDALDRVVKQLGEFKPSVIDALEGKPCEFWEIKGELESKNHHSWRNIPIASPFYPDLDSDILHAEFCRCRRNYTDEIHRREKYIHDNGLEKILNPLSWRWGMKIGRVKLQYFKPYHDTFYRMYMKEAFRTKDYTTAGALDTMFSAINDKTWVPAQDNTYEYQDEMLLTGYSSYYNKDFQLFNPLNGASFEAEVVRGDDHFLELGFFDEARKKFMQTVWEKTDEMHLLNFHSVAIMQNILDNRKIFPEHEVDFITGDGMDKIHRVYDDENMIPSQESKDRISPTDLVNKILSDTFAMAHNGQDIFLLKNYEMKTEYGGRYERNTVYESPLSPSKGDKPYRHNKVEITYFNKLSITAEGMISQHRANNYSKMIWAGTPKSGKVTIKLANNVYGNKKTFVSKEAIRKNERLIKDTMARREFQEEFYLSHGVALKYILKLARDSQ